MSAQGDSMTDRLHYLRLLTCVQDRQVLIAGLSELQTSKMTQSHS